MISVIIIGRYNITLFSKYETTKIKNIQEKEVQKRKNIEHRSSCYTVKNMQQTVDQNMLRYI